MQRAVFVCMAILIVQARGRGTDFLSKVAKPANEEMERYGQTYFFPFEQNDFKIKQYVHLIGKEHPALAHAATYALDLKLVSQQTIRNPAEHDLRDELMGLMTEAEDLVRDPRVHCPSTPREIHGDFRELASNLANALLSTKAVSHLGRALDLNQSAATYEAFDLEKTRVLSQIRNAVAAAKAAPVCPGTGDSSRRLVDNASTTDAPWYEGMPTETSVNSTQVFADMQKGLAQCNESVLAPLLEEWRQRVAERQMWPPSYCLWNQEHCVSAFVTKMMYEKGTSCLVLYPATVEEQVLAMELVTKYGLPYSPRGGNHDNLALSTIPHGVTIDTSANSFVKVSDDGNTARIGSGTNLLQVYHDLWYQGKKMIPGGTCPGVGNVGLSTAGGYGMTTQEFGLTVDNVIGYDVWTPATGLVKTSKDNYSDLFWACRGGRCANAGVVTETTVIVHDIDQVTVVTLTIPMTYAVNVTEHFLQESLTIRKKWTWAVRWGSGAGRTPEEQMISVTGQWNGPIEEYLAEIQPIIIPADLWAQVKKNDTQQMSYLESVGYWGYGTSPYEIVHDYKSNLLAAHASFSSGQTMTSYLYEPLARDQLQRMFSIFFDDSGYLAENGVAKNYRFYPYNGIIHESIGGDTSFSHREQFMEVQLMVYGSNFMSSKTSAKWNEWLGMARSVINEGVPECKQKTYPNFPIYDVKDWKLQYWSAPVVAKLEQVKAKFDPNNTWSNPQSIPLASLESDQAFSRAFPSSLPSLRNTLVACLLAAVFASK